MGTTGTWGAGGEGGIRAAPRPPHGHPTAAYPRTWAWTARWKAPRLKGSMEPLWLRVPSGKTHTRT